MAEGTIILRPVADVSLKHSAISGGNEKTVGWNLIDDTTTDKDSTFIRHTIQEATKAETKSSTFRLGGDTLVDNARITTATTVFSLACTGDSNSLSVNFIVGGTSCFSEAKALTEKLDSDNNAVFVNLIWDCSGVVASINNYILNNNEFPQIDLEITTAFPKTNEKQAISISQVYLELGYKTGLGIYKKVNGVWTQAQAAYKKTDGVWVGMTEAECKQYMQSVNIK